MIISQTHNPFVTLPCPSHVIYYNENPHTWYLLIYCQNASDGANTICHWQSLLDILVPWGYWMNMFCRMQICVDIFRQIGVIVSASVFLVANLLCLWCWGIVLWIFLTLHFLLGKLCLLILFFLTVYISHLRRGINWVAMFFWYLNLLMFLLESVNLQSNFIIFWCTSDKELWRFTKFCFR